MKSYNTEEHLILTPIHSRDRLSSWELYTSEVDRCHRSEQVAAYSREDQWADNDTTDSSYTAASPRQRQLLTAPTWYTCVQVSNN